MKNIFIFFIFSFVFHITSLHAQSVISFINEVNYLASNPTERGVEIAGTAGSNLAGWSIVGYAVDGTVEYVEYMSAGIIPNKQNGYGSIWYDVEQSSNEGGMALVSPNNEVIQFISFGTVGFANVIISAVAGAANGMVSEYIGTQLTAANSLQLIGTGLTYLDFVWGLPLGKTPGEVNSLQSFLGNQAAAATPTNHMASFETNTIQNWKVNAYPNPVVASLQIRFATELNTDATIEIYNIKGQLIEQQQLEAGAISTEINFGLQQAGQYILNIQTQDQSDSKIIVKQ